MSRENYKRVSQVLSMLRDYNEINPEVLNDKAKVGTEVHENIHRYNTDGFEEFELYPIRDRHGEIIHLEDGTQKWERRGVGYFQSYCKWHQQNYPSYEMMEQRFYDDELEYTGQIDGLIRRGPDYILVDFKTSYKADVEIWALQAHAYAHLLRNNGYRDMRKMLFMQLQKNGRFPKIFEFDFNEKTIDRFITLCHLYDDLKRDTKGVD